MAMDLNRDSVLSEIRRIAYKYQFKLVSLSDMRYRIEFNRAVIIFGSKDVTILNSNYGKVVLFPYKVDIHEIENENSSNTIKLEVYVGRTVGIPYGFIYEISIDTRTFRSVHKIIPNQTTVYSLNNSVGNVTYASALNVIDRYKLVSTIEYRGLVKGNLPYFNRNLSELVSILTTMYEYLPKGNTPDGISDAGYRLIKRYERAGYELYKNDKYYKLVCEDGTCTYFSVNIGCYDVLQLNRFMIDEYKNENENNFNGIKVLKDKHRIFTQYITVKSDGAFEVIFNLINKKYYLKFKIFLLKCFNEYDNAEKELKSLTNSVDNLEVFQQNIIEEVYAM